MIATTGFSQRVDIYNSTATDASFTFTNSSLCTPHRYHTIERKRKSLKEWMKIWAYERMIKTRHNPVKDMVTKPVQIKPIPLRCVMIGKNGWANQK